MTDTTTTSVTDAPNETGATSTDATATAIANLQSGTNARVWASITGDDFDSKATVLNAITNAVPLRDHFGRHIELLNVVVQAVDITDPKTGEVTGQPRVILLDADGTAYYGVSPVLLKALETFTGVLGQPHTWPGPVGIKVTQEKSNKGFNYYNMTLDKAPASNEK